MNTVHSSNNSAQNSTATVDRRTILKGAAWSIPVVAVAVAAPAAASSTVTCTTGAQALSLASWSTVAGSLAAWESEYSGWGTDVAADTITGTYAGGQHSTLEGFTSGADSAEQIDQGGVPTINRVSYTVPNSAGAPIFAGALYSASFDINASYGYVGGPTRSERQSLHVSAWQNGVQLAVSGDTKLTLAHQSEWGPAYLTAPTAESDADMTAQGYTLLRTYTSPNPTYSYTALAVSTSPIEWRLDFVMAPLPVVGVYTAPNFSNDATRWVNDDLSITNPVLGLAVCP